MKMDFSNKIWDIASDIEKDTRLMIEMLTNIEQDRAGSIQELDQLLECIEEDASKLREIIK